MAYYQYLEGSVFEYYLNFEFFTMNDVIKYLDYIF